MVPVKITALSHGEDAAQQKACPDRVGPPPTATNNGNEAERHGDQEEPQSEETLVFNVGLLRLLLRPLALLQRLLALLR